MDDWQLIQAYAREQSEAAFRALVERHTGLVYASALRQVREANLAQDVAQAVFILLARKACRLRRGTVLSGWLFQTTRFVAARAMRSELRRQRREREAFDMQQLSSADDTWARIAPVIDEALAELGAADRNAILLRYVEGRSLREVSTELGVTEEAAKKRVARAVEKLRQKLARGGATLSATAISAALVSNASAVPAAALITAWSAQTVAATTATGTVAALVTETLAAWRWMKLKWFAGGSIALVALVAGFLTLVNHQQKTDTRLPTSGLAFSTDGSSTAITVPVMDPAQSLVTSRQEGPNLKHLQLRVVSADSSEAVSNAAVFLSVWRQQSVENHWDLRTDASGNCDIAYESDSGRIDVGVLQDGWAARYVTWPNAESSGFPTEYVLKLARVTNAIGGIVQDSLGNPLGNVEIWFGGLDTGDSAHRERPRERFGFLSAVPATRTDAQGRWTLRVVPPEHRGFYLEGRHPDFADTTLISGAAQQRLGEIQSTGLKKLWAGELISTMDDAFTLMGTVVDEWNAPIAGVKIQNRPQSDVCISDDAGNFRVPKLRAGSWTFTAVAEGFAPVRTNALIGPGTLPSWVVLRPGAVLRLRVIDEEGLPVPDVEVGMEQWGENRHDFDWRDKTDFDGRIEWTSAPRDVELELFARKDGFCYTRDVRVKADENVHIITVNRALLVFGRVVDSETSQAVQEFSATPGYGAADRFHDSELRWYGGATVRGTNGLFKLSFEEKVHPWLLRVTADGYEDWVSGPLTNRIQLALDIAMKRAQADDTVRGVVLNPDGSPAAGAQVALLAFDHSVQLRQQAFSGNPRWLAKTGEDGRFSFPINRLAHSVAAVSSVGYVHQRILDATQPLTLRLELWGRVEGIVDASAATHGVAKVELYDPAADNYQGRVSLLGSYSTQPDISRRFVFEQVPPGEFCVFVNSMNNLPFHHQTPLIVRPAETTTVVIGNRSGTRVSGRFLAPLGKVIDWNRDLVASQLYADLSSVSAFINSVPEAERPMRELDFWTSPAAREHINTPRIFSAVVKEDGSFTTLEKLPPGDYRFTTTFREGDSATQQITIGEDQPEELPLGEIQLR